MNLYYFINGYRSHWVRWNFLFVMFHENEVRDVYTLSVITCSATQHVLQVNNRNNRTRCEICSKLTIKTPERHHWCRSGVFIGNFEHISHLVLVFSIVKFKHVNTGWVAPCQIPMIQFYSKNSSATFS